MARLDGSVRGRVLMEVEEQFRRWRRGRKRGEKIPHALWRAAVELVEQYSLGEIASTLALDYGRLEKRVGKTAQTLERRADLESAADSGGFVEVGTLKAGYSDECTVEAEDGSGNKLTIHMKGGGCARAVELARALWSVDR